jgi:uncharacterized protein YndB with AHSA1/START domain
MNEMPRRHSATDLQCFLGPELKRQWFANPGNWPDAVWELHFHVGGREVNSCGLPGGTHHAFKSRFHDIAEDERIVFANDLLFHHRLVSVSLTTIEFFLDSDGKRLVFTEQGAFFDDLEDLAEREPGTGKLLDAPERFLARERVR